MRNHEQPDSVERCRGLAGHRGRTAAPAGRSGTDRLGKLRQPGRDGCPGLRDDQQVRRGLPRPALLRRLRERRCRRTAGHRARQQAVRRRVRQRPAALRSPGQHGRVLRLPGAGRHAAGHGPVPRRPPHPRHAPEFLGQAVQGGPLRSPPGRSAHRLRPGRPAGPRTQAQTDRGRGQRLSPDDRFQRLRRGLLGATMPADGGHGPHRRPGGGRAASQSGALVGLRHLDHPQDPARSARRLCADCATRSGPRRSTRRYFPACKAGR